jgi:hypothetical protein
MLKADEVISGSIGDEDVLGDADCLNDQVERECAADDRHPWGEGQ